MSNCSAVARTPFIRIARPMHTESNGHEDLAFTDTSKHENKVATPTEDETLNKQAAFGGGWRGLAIITALSIVALHYCQLSRIPSY